jgi:divalent metal cation (Fe/Co/Zn/Cd) transporter
MTLAPKVPLQNPIIQQNDDLQDIARIALRLILLKSQDEINTKYERLLEGRISTRLSSFLLRILRGKENVEWAKEELTRIQDEGTRASYSIRLEEDISLRESEIIKQQ